MKLGLWLTDQRITRRHFAELVGVHPVTVSKWVTGRMVPRAEQLDLIGKHTSGGVQPNDFFENFAQPTPSAAEAGA